MRCSVMYDELAAHKTCQKIIDDSDCAYGFVVYSSRALPYCVCLYAARNIATLS